MSGFIFAFAVGGLCFRAFSPSNIQFTTVPLVFALGGIALLIKGIFLMRKSSEGPGLSDQELAKLLVLGWAVRRASSNQKIDKFRSVDKVLTSTNGGGFAVNQN